jgi:hypothetical protein
VRLFKVFLLMVLLGGAGGALGSMVGHFLGRGGLIAGGIVGGIALVAAGGFVSAARQWIAIGQRLWVIIGGVLGFGLAVMVALSTLSSPVGPILSTLLIGTGAVLGALVGRSPHAEP